MKALTILILMFSFQLASAQTPQLKDVMKEIGEQFKTIAIAIQSGEIKATDLDAVETLQTLVSQASMMYPATAETMELKLKYSELMNELMDQSLVLDDEAELAMSGSPQNLSNFKKIFCAINKTRQKGHEEFKIE